MKSLRIAAVLSAFMFFAFTTVPASATSSSIDRSGAKQCSKDTTKKCCKKSASKKTCTKKTSKCEKK